MRNLQREACLSALLTLLLCLVSFTDIGSKNEASSAEEPMIQTVALHQEEDARQNG